MSVVDSFMLVLVQSIFSTVAGLVIVLGNIQEAAEVLKQYSLYGSWSKNQALSTAGVTADTVAIGSFS